MKPGTLVVCALIDDQVVGWASWGLPKRLWRSETLADVIYRKVIEYKDALEDWLFPSWWYNFLDGRNLIVYNRNAWINIWDQND